MALAVFSRSPGLPAIRGVCVDSFDGLAALPPNALVTDLALGAWRGNHAAAEWCGQLGLALPELSASSMNFQLGQGGQLSYADSIGELVDAETKGDIPVLFALRTAERIAGHLGAQSLIAIAPRHGQLWEPENELLLRFLAQALGPRLLIVGAPEATPPQHFTIAWEPFSAPASTTPGLPKDPFLLQPGLLPAGPLAETWQWPLASGARLIAPWLRPDPKAYSRLAFDRLAALAPPGGWLAAYANCHGNTIFTDFWLLCEQAQQRFIEGGYGIAFRLLDRAVACAPSAESKALALAAMQGMRIAIHRFADAAGAPDPPPGAPPGLAQFLRQSKGWGLVMTGRTAESADHFQAALQHPGTRGSERERLYLRNIAALSAARLGHIDAALQAELEIEEQLDALPAMDWHLCYINSLNLARLFRRRKNWDRARHLYHRAFETMDGARSGSDGLYVNLTFAQLETEAGDLDAARPYWLRAALHWASFDAPEALAWRVATAALGRQVGPGQIVDEAVSAYLHLQLSLAFPEVSAAQPLPFARVSSHCVAAAGAPGWAVLFSPRLAIPPSTGPENTRLRALLAAIVAPPDFQGTVVVPECHGRELPTCRESTRALCLELDIPSLIYAGSPVSMNRQGLVSHLQVHLGPLVSGLSATSSGALAVSFKRYLSQETLTGSASRLVGGLGSSRPLTACLEQGFPEDLVRWLQDRRVLTVGVAPA